MDTAFPDKPRKRRSSYCLAVKLSVAVSLLMVLAFGGLMCRSFYVRDELSKWSEKTTLWVISSTGILQVHYGWDYPIGFPVLPDRLDYMSENIRYSKLRHTFGLGVEWTPNKGEVIKNLSKSNFGFKFKLDRNWHYWCIEIPTWAFAYAAFIFPQVLIFLLKIRRPCLRGNGGWNL